MKQFLHLVMRQFKSIMLAASVKRTGEFDLLVLLLKQPLLQLGHEIAEFLCCFRLIHSIVMGAYLLNLCGILLFHDLRKNCCVNINAAVGQTCRCQFLNAETAMIFDVKKTQIKRRTAEIKNQHIVITLFLIEQLIHGKHRGKRLRNDFLYRDSRRPCRLIDAAALKPGGADGHGNDCMKFMRLTVQLLLQALTESAKNIRRSINGRNIALEIGDGL